MFSQKTLWVSLASLVLLAGTSNVALAKTPVSPLKQTSQFRQIEQPLALKAGVAIGGFIFIGLELWWFLFYKSPES